MTDSSTPMSDSIGEPTDDPTLESRDDPTRRPTHRPTVPGSVLAFAAGFAAVALLIDDSAQWRALLVEVVGLVVVAGGYVAWQRRRRVGGLLTAVAGVLLIGAGLVLGLTMPSAIIHRFELLPGMLGLMALLAGLLPIRSGWERAFVTTGAALLFVGVVTSGVVRGAALLSLLGAGIASVVAWDLGDQAISLGRQVGRGAKTYRAELTHAGATSIVGGGTLVATSAVHRFDVRGLSLTGLAVLLVAGFLLAVSLRQ